MAGVIGSPDAVRGEVVKAYIVLADHVTRDDAVHDDIQDFVKRELSAHEYPRQIRFIDALPLTVTGKIQRMRLRELDRDERKETG